MRLPRLILEETSKVVPNLTKFGRDLKVAEISNDYSTIEGSTYHNEKFSLNSVSLFEDYIWYIHMGKCMAFKARKMGSVNR